MDLRRLFGNTAEDLAAQYLRAKGYAILKRQYRTKFGEIDLVARLGDEIVFVEVKARKGTGFGHPEESVTETKLEKISAAGHQYLSKYPAESFRIDVISITYKNDVPQIVHFEGVG